MSYILLPRLGFSGQFRLGNSATSLEVHRPDNIAKDPGPLGHHGKSVPGWCPDGAAAFHLDNVVIQTAQLAIGATEFDSATGLQLKAKTQSASANLVDLDPQFKTGSELWGLAVVLTDGQQELMRADFLPAACRDVNPARGNNQWSAKFTSILTNVQWPTEVLLSDTLIALRDQAIQNQNRLSINLMTYGYSALNLKGNLVGSIGSWSVGQPERFVLGRRFSVVTPGDTTTPSGIGFFDAEVGESVSLDLGNALPLIRDSGELLDINSLSAVVLKTPDKVKNLALSNGYATAGIAQSEDIDRSQFDLLGEIPYRTRGWLKKTAGIVDFVVPAALKKSIEDRPLALVTPAGTPGKYTVLIRETVGGLFVRADQSCYRVDSLKNKDVIVDTTLHAAIFGKPTGGCLLDLTHCATSSRHDVKHLGLSASGQQPTGIPANALAFTDQVITDSNGRAVVPVRVSDPRNPRGTIDGQVFKIAFDFSINGTSPLPLNDTLVLHVRAALVPPESPTWIDDVEPIIRQYSNLHAVIHHGLFNFTDREVIERNASLFKLAFELPLGDPNHLPATRDLSSGKLHTILAYLDNYISGDKKAVFVALSKHRIADPDTSESPQKAANIVMSIASSGRSDSTNLPPLPLPVTNKPPTTKGKV